MAWSNETKKVLGEVNGAIKFSRNELDDSIIDACITACQESWSELKQYVNTNRSKPYSGMPAINDAQRVTNAVLDLQEIKGTSLDDLFNPHKSPKIPSDQEEYAKQFIGALVLRNGIHKSEKPSKDYLEDKSKPD